MAGYRRRHTDAVKATMDTYLCHMSVAELCWGQCYKLVWDIVIKHGFFTRSAADVGVSSAVDSLWIVGGDVAQRATAATGLLMTAVRLSFHRRPSI